MTRDELLAELAVERYARPLPPPPRPAADVGRRQRILLGLESPDDFMPPRQRRDITDEAVRLTTSLRWSPRQVAAVLEVPEATVVAALRRRKRSQNQRTSKESTD